MFCTDKGLLIEIMCRYMLRKSNDVGISYCMLKVNELYLTKHNKLLCYKRVSKKEIICVYQEVSFVLSLKCFTIKILM
jgi:hypothetical protein